MNDINDQIRLLFDRKKIFDDFSQDIDSDTNSNNGDDKEDDDICEPMTNELGMFRLIYFSYNSK